MEANANSATSRSARSLEEHARWAFEKIGRHDLSDAEEIWAADAVDHFLPVGDAIGRDGIVAFLNELFAAFPDMRVEVERIVVADRVIVVQWRGRGTFTGSPFGGIRPTGRAVDFQAVDVVDVDDEKLVVENTIYWDGARFARQIGILPAENSRADRLMVAAFNAFTWLRTLGGRRLGRGR